MEFYDKFEDMFQDLSKVKKSCFHLMEGIAITQNLEEKMLLMSGNVMFSTMPYLKVLESSWKLLEMVWFRKILKLKVQIETT